MLDKKFVRRGLFLVFLILFLDIMGIAIIVPVLPTYLEELTGADIGEAAVDGGWLLLVYSAMQFLFAPLIGNLSDRFGRRPVLLASVLTFALDNLICALATSYWMLFIGRSLAGISGASFGTASAYIADVSDDENRAKNFGLIGIAFGTGFALGRSSEVSSANWARECPFMVRQRFHSSISSWASFSCPRRSPRPTGGASNGTGQTRSARSSRCAITRASAG